MGIDKKAKKDLKDLTLPYQCRSDCGSSITDLYDQCLPASSRFDRAVGFFASSCLQTCPRGYAAFFAGGGVMRIVTSHILEERDLRAISDGLNNRPTAIRNFDISQLSVSLLEQRPLQALTWLVATGRLSLRIAVLKEGAGRSLYHEKIGIFIDQRDNAVAYTGSSNESSGGLQRNFESIEVFRSWRDHEAGRVSQKRRDFDALWLDDTDSLAVYPFPVAARLGVLKARPRDQDALSAAQSHTLTFTKETPFILDLPGLEETLMIPPTLHLRDHQKKAVKAWFEHSGKGVFEMATGSGKTIAALAAAVKFYEFFGAQSPVVILIVCPFLHLVAQWRDIAMDFGLDPVLCIGSHTSWTDALSTRLLNMAMGKRRILSVVTTNATFSNNALQSFISQRLPRSAKTLFIADEVHNLGAGEIGMQLPADIEYRLGLSATPDRVHDATGTASIRGYFGESVATFTLEEALKNNILCPYEYHPVPVELAEHELDEYTDLTNRIMWHADKDGNLDFNNPKLMPLLLRRSRLLAVASQKLPALLRVMSQFRHQGHNLVYCGDGTVETEPDTTVVRQIDAVVKALGVDLEMTVAKYVAETPLLRRESIRRSFTAGAIQALVAIRCLDEGVDIPEIRRAFILASSTNPRQFIQRRGRILRRAPNKEMAWIYDFLVVPPLAQVSKSDSVFQVTRNLFARELHRVAEFAQLAVNGPEAYASLLPIRQRLDLVGL